MTKIDLEVWEREQAVLRDEARQRVRAVMALVAAEAAPEPEQDNEPLGSLVAWLKRMVRRVS